MSLEDDLKARTLALISQQMANWVVEIQRQIGQHQGNLVRSLDELVESVARYDEKINEREIASAMSAVVAAQPPAAAGGADLGRLKASLAEIEKGASLSEVLTYLVNEAGKYVERAAMFIVKGQAAMGWYARGIQPPDAVKINVPLNVDTVFRIVHNSRHPLRGHLSQVPGTAQALARFGGNPQGILAVPLILRDKLAAILYCDSSLEEIPAEDADVIEVLVLFAAKNIDLLSAVPRPAGASTTAGTTTDRAAAIRAAGEERGAVAPSRPGGTGPQPVAARVGTGPQPVASRSGTGPQPVAPAPAPPVEESASTVMFSAASLRGAAGTPARPATAPSMPRPNVPGMPPQAPRPTSPEEHKAHEDAKRFARLVVSEIKLYNETKVAEGRRSKDLYERLKEDIERGRQMYSDRVAAGVRDSTNYFFDELVRILAGGDASALGPM
jgi:hypothetical protein